MGRGLSQLWEGASSVARGIRVPPSDRLTHPNVRDWRHVLPEPVTAVHGANLHRRHAERAASAATRGGSRLCPFVLGCRCRFPASVKKT